MHRFILDNDGSNITYNLGEDVHAIVEEAVRECPPNVTTYLLCSGAGCAYWPTKVGHVDPRAKALVAAHARGVDPLGMLLRAMKATGRETFITCRMNDVHNPTDADQWNTPRVRRDHPDCVVGAEEIKAGKADWMSYCLDYSRREVRDYQLALLAEQVELYGSFIDGFHLDWMRFPRHLSGTPDEVWAKRDALTSFIADAKHVLARAGRKLQLAVRVPPWVPGCRRLGMDLKRWVDDGLIDWLVTCPFLTTEWSIDCNAFRAEIGGPRVPIYAGFDFRYGRNVHCPESLRGIAANLFDQKADGIYLFNFPCWIEYLPARPYHWLIGLDRPQTASAKPLQIGANNWRNRVPHVDSPAVLPARLEPGKAIDVPVHIPAAALPAWRCIVHAHTHGDVRLLLNGKPATDVRFGNDFSGQFRAEIFPEFIDLWWDTDSRPKPENCRVFRVDARDLVAGTNTFRVEHVAGGAQEIERLNLALW